MEVLYPRCAGLDVHQATVVACVRIASGARAAQEVRTFDTTTKGLLALADWLRESRCTHVAMESTGVYWKPVWHVLEGDFELVLANATHIRNVPGRKTDVNDATWIADLLAHGLIRGSFVPPGDVQELRDLTRTRKQLVRELARHTQRIQKTLEDANIKIVGIISDILGASGRAFLEVIITGEDDPEKLADLARGRLKTDRQRIIEALRGRVQAHHRFMLKLHLQQIDSLKKAVAEIEERLGEPPGTLSRRGEASGDHTWNQPDRRARDRQRDGPGYDSLCQCRPPGIVGRPLPAQRRERRQTPLHPDSQGRAVAEDHPDPSCLGRGAHQELLPACDVPST